RPPGAFGRVTRAGGSIQPCSGISGWPLAAAPATGTRRRVTVTARSSPTTGRKRMSETTEHDLDLITHSPDGESRGADFRAGDIIPMDPRPHQRLSITEPATEARPWGLRFLRAPRPTAG